MVRSYETVCVSSELNRGAAAEAIWEKELLEINTPPSWGIDLSFRDVAWRSLIATYEKTTSSGKLSPTLRADMMDAVAQEPRSTVGKGKQERRLKEKCFSRELNLLKLFADQRTWGLGRTTTAAVPVKNAPLISEPQVDVMEGQLEV